MIAQVLADRPQAEQCSFRLSWGGGGVGVKVGGFFFFLGGGGGVKLLAGRQRLLPAPLLNADQSQASPVKSREGTATTFLKY